jgi:hypothetical protein
MIAQEDQLPATAAVLITSALPLLADAGSIGEQGDSSGRCIQIATIQLEALLASETGLRGDVMTDHLDMLYDAASLLEAAAALHPRCGRGLILRAVIDQLDLAAGAIGEAQLEPGKTAISMLNPAALTCKASEEVPA